MSWRGSWEGGSAVRIATLGAPPTRADLAVLDDRLRARLERDPADLVVCDLAHLVAPEVAIVEALARLQLTARRHGAEMRLCNVSHALHDLLAVAGLCDVVGVCPDLGLEAERQAEEREPALGVEEEGDPADPIA